MRRGLYRRSRQGGRSQRTILHLPFTSVSDPRDLANVNGLGGVYGVPTLLWVVGDGDVPTIGPGLTAAGVPTVGATPWQLADGSDVVSEVHTGASYRNTATVLDPTIGQDIIITGLIKKPNLTGGISSILCNRTAGGGFQFRFSALAVRCVINDGVGFISPFVLVPDASLLLVQVIIDGDGNSYIVVNGAPNAPTATPAAGVIGSGDGVGVACYADGSNPMSAGGEIIFASFEYGNGIADAWIADGFARCVDFANRFTGLHPIAGDTPAFARNSAASWEDHNGIWHIASPGLPRAGDEDGLREEPTSTNKTYNTINPQSNAGWSRTGGAHTVPSDAAQLLANGAQNWGPNIHQFVPGVGDQVIYGGALSANTNDHSSSVFMRGLAGGESVDIVGRDVSAGTVVNLGTVVLTTAWVRYIVDGWTPADTDIQFGLDCDLGDTVLFIGSQMEEGAVSTLPIPNFSTIAAAARPFDDLTTAETPANIEGSVELIVEPLGWGGTDAGIVPVLWLTAGGTAVLYVNAGGTWECDIDGTTQLDSTVAPVDGVAQTIRLRWTAAAGVMSIDVDGTRVQGAYDGGLLAAGTWQTVSAATLEIRDLKAYRTGS